MPGSRMPLDTPLRVAAIAVLTAVACGVPRPTCAGAPGYEIQLGVIESDNIERLPTGGTNATIGVEELGLTWHDKRPWLDADIDADVGHLNYFQHTYADQFIGNFLGQVKVDLAPDLLTWGFSDNFGQVPIQPLAPITPANQENINFFSTGPTLSLPLGQTTRLDVTGQYDRVNYQRSPLDGVILTGGVGLQHDLSPGTTIAVDARDDSVRFSNDQLNPDYQRQEAFARFDTKGSRTELDIDLGYSRLRLPGANDSIPLARLDLSRRVSTNSTIGVAVGHDYSDGADSFRLVQAVGGANLNTQPIVAAAAPFVGSYGTLGWNFKYARTVLNLGLSYFRDRYRTDPTLDNERTVADALVARQISPTMQLALTEYLVHWHFDSDDQNATTTDTALQLTWRVGTRLTVFLSYYLAKGSSNVPAFVYTENRVWLSIGYGRAAEALPGPAPLRLPGPQQ